MPFWLRFLLGEIIVVTIIIFVVIPYFGWYEHFWDLFFSTHLFGIGYFIGEGIGLLFEFIRDKFN